MTTWKTDRLVPIGILGLCFSMFAGCGGPERDWSRASRANTPKAYRAYAAKYPSSGRIIRVTGEFTGHSIMIGEDGAFHAGPFGGGYPEFEIRSVARPDFVYKLAVGSATAAGLLKGGRLELAANYTYTDAEMIVLVAREKGPETHTLVYFKCGQSTFKADDGQVRSSKARALSVSLLRDSQAE
jgi:hypothetical protein